MMGFGVGPTWGSSGNWSNGTLLGTGLAAGVGGALLGGIAGWALRGRQERKNNDPNYISLWDRIRGRDNRHNGSNTRYQDLNNRYNDIYTRLNTAQPTNIAYNNTLNQYFPPVQTQSPIAYQPPMPLPYNNGIVANTYYESQPPLTSLPPANNQFIGGTQIFNVNSLQPEPIYMPIPVDNTGINVGTLNAGVVNIYPDTSLRAPQQPIQWPSHVPQISMQQEMSLQLA